MSSDAPFIGGLYANNSGEIVASNIQIHMTGEESDAVVSAGGPGVITISESTLLMEGEGGKRHQRLERLANPVFECRDRNAGR
ncbi:hypothetical protein ACFO8O_02095 [Hephaestia sp. GCM10023244]|uniref:hypothetical protein n=1 Tax=unclassified Hephaestia TaxID=2631281 RepID=UPI002076F6A3|nr:hypothetical protein [Hephaestia sp. MAHUQ-44]MCM8729763.1 hypothetical protein [Hephaestia sp. MAHUQ-44]